MALKRRPSFDPKAFLAKVCEGRSINTYHKGQIVFSQGDPADAVYVQRGKVKVTVVSEQGKEAVVAMLGQNEFFGEGCLAGQAKRIATAATTTDSVIARLEKAAILRVIHQEPAFAEMFIKKGYVVSIKEAINLSSDKSIQSFDSSLHELYKQGRIGLEEALANADSRANLEAKINFG